MSYAPSHSKQKTGQEEDPHRCKCDNCKPKKPRTIVLAFDGTGDQFDDENTNVVKLCGVLDMQSPHQLVYYQPGIGTYTPPGVRGKIQNKIAKFADICFGWYLSQHVMDGYEYLMNHHEPGDKICIFGFSRGAYTARALAGMLHHVGLLAQGNHEQVPNAWRLYKNQDELGDKFKKTFCKEVTIDMLGVWDTVGSVGYFRPQVLPFVSNKSVRVFRHAISIDEHRKRFGVELWDIPKDNTEGGHTNNYDFEPDVLEVWFAGCHCDVGGGNWKDSQVDAQKLANISLRWMLNQIQGCSTVIFKNDLLDYWNIPIDCVERRISAKQVRSSKMASSSSSATKAGVATRRRHHATEDTLLDHSDDDEDAVYKDGSNPLIDSCLINDKPTCRNEIRHWAKQDESDYQHGPVKDEMNWKQMWWYIAQAFTWSGKWIDNQGRRKFPLNPDWMYSKIHYSVWDRIAYRTDYKPTAVYLNEPLSRKEEFITGKPPI